MMKVVIIEDEIISSRRLERMLTQLNHEVLVCLSTVASAIEWFGRNESIDIIFMDIHLSDGMCFDIFGKIKITQPIIFTTAYSDYSLKAFDYNSVSYLLKPINKTQLEKAIEKAKTFHTSKSELEKLKTIIGSNNFKVFKTEFAVRTGKKIKIIKAEEIECFFSLENTTYLRANDFNYIINDTLSRLENLLNEAHFYRVSRKYIVNKSSIETIHSYPNSRFKIDLKSYNENEIIVSRERAKLFKIWIGQ